MKEITFIGVGVFIGWALLQLYRYSNQLFGPLATGFLLLIIIAGVVFLFVVWIGFWVSRQGVDYRRKQAETKQVEMLSEYIPMTDGFLPVPKSVVDNSPSTAIELAKDFHRSNWKVGNVPLRLTINGNTEPPKPVEKERKEVPTFTELYKAKQLPSEGFLLGYDSDNNPVVADWKKLYSTLIGGLSNTGKSTLVRSILTQASNQNGKIFLIDPHFNAGEDSLGSSLKPLESLFLAPIAYDDSSILETLRLTSEMIDRRLSGIDSNTFPVILVIDELTALLQKSTVKTQLSEVLRRISMETRKVGIYTICIGQNFNSKLMDTTIRNSFISFISFKARKSVARVMTENLEFAEVAQGLAIGQAIWLAPNGTMVEFTVPNLPSKDVPRIAEEKLSKKERVEKVQKLREKFSPKQLAEKFNVSLATIYNDLKG